MEIITNFLKANLKKLLFGKRRIYVRKGKMVEQNIESKYLQEKLSLKIYTPEDYSPFQQYNLCLMQDGNDYYQMGRVATISDQLHEDGEIEHTIFVGIHYQDRYDRRKKYHPDGEQFQTYIQFIIKEVVPFLDENYQIRTPRILMGDSLAGTLAFMIASKYPHIFSKIMIQSPYIDQTVLQQAKNSKNISLLDIYHTIGEDETAVKTTDGKIVDFLTPNRSLSNILSQTASSYEYKEIESGKHTWGYWQKDLPTALKYILR